MVIMISNLLFPAGGKGLGLQRQLFIIINYMEEVLVMMDIHFMDQF
jgi:hypothetical protein